jgi:1-acyl-sn-glycerol-3-phosphate acyltransferase
LGEFKKGTFVLAIETQAPIVPIALDGGYRVARRGRIRPSDMTLSIAPPIPTEGKGVRDRDEVLRAVRVEIVDMLEGAIGSPAPSTEAAAVTDCPA